MRYQKSILFLLVIIFSINCYAKKETIILQKGDVLKIVCGKDKYTVKRNILVDEIDIQCMLAAKKAYEYPDSVTKSVLKDWYKLCRNSPDVSGCRLIKDIADQNCIKISKSIYSYKLDMNGFFEGSLEVILKNCKRKEYLCP